MTGAAPKGTNARLPIASFLYCISVYEMFRHKPEIETFWEPPDFDLVGNFVKLCYHFGFDGLHTLGRVWDSGMSTFSDCSVAASAENWDVTIVDEPKTDELHRTITIRTPAGDLGHTENYRRSSTYFIVSAPEDHFIKSKRDFELLRKYGPLGDDMDCSPTRRAKAAVGDNGLLDA